MSINHVEQDFQKKVSEKIHLVSEGTNRFRVNTPFRFDDGDHIVIVLKEEGSDWILSDEAHTYMRLTYDLEEKQLTKGERQKIISNALTVNQVQDRDGELIICVPDQQYGDALYSFIQAIMRISDVSYLSKERVRSTFKEDFRALVSEIVSQDRIDFDWYDSGRDPQKNYVVDCRINSMPRPLFVQALANNASTSEATIVLLQFERWGVPFHSLAIFEDQETISRKTLARYSDVCEKQYSSIAVNRDRIKQYLQESIKI